MDGFICITRVLGARIVAVFRQVLQGEISAQVPSQVRVKYGKIRNFHWSRELDLQEVICRLYKGGPISTLPHRPKTPLSQEKYTIV